jgi:hypothetical protein
MSAKPGEPRSVFIESCDKAVGFRRVARHGNRRTAACAIEAMTDMSVFLDVN